MQTAPDVAEDRPYKCERCDKSYTRRDYLERHILNHNTSAKRCPSCGKTFARNDVLQKHLRQACKGRSVDTQSETDDTSNKRPRLARDTPIDTANDPAWEGTLSTLEVDLGNASSTSQTTHTSFPPVVLPLQSTLAPAFSLEQQNTPGNPFAFDEEPRTLPVRVESSVGHPNPVSVPPSWTGAAPIIENMEDIFGWLFQTGDAEGRTEAETSRTLGEEEPQQPPQRLLSAMGFTNDISLNSEQGDNASARAHRSMPADFHPYNVRNTPLRRNALYSQISVPQSWRLPEPGPVIDQSVWLSILSIYDSPLRDQMASVMTAQRMSLYLELYFLHFAPLYPIIHRPSMGYRALPPDLLATMICIGTAFAAERQGFDLATKMVKRLRDRIFEKVEEEPRLDIQSLQTVLQLNHFSRSYCSLKQHDVSQIFHSPSMTLCRLSGVFSPNFSSMTKTPSEDPMRRWLEWVDLEERTRVGWFAFMMDIENAALFRHYLLIHSFVIEIPFPVSEKVWAATSPQHWQIELQNCEDLPSHRDVLRELTGRGTIHNDMCWNTLWILLHSIISVSWTLLWRDLGDLAMVGDTKITQWKVSLRKAFDVWLERAESLQPAGQLSDSAMRIMQSGVAFARLGAVLLLTETEHIRIFAGAPSVAARPVPPAEWFAASAYVSTWANSQDAAYAVHAALKALQMIFRTIDEGEYRNAPSVVAWCTYISALVVWAYATKREGADNLMASYIIPDGNDGRQVRLTIEPSIARREAMKYLAEQLEIGHPFDLVGKPGKARCASIIAYAAHLTGTLRRGIMDESRSVLLGLLSEYL